MEALVASRAWPDSARRLHPLAERTGLIGPLTHYVLDAALHQCHRWRQAGHELAVAVNVSARSLLDLAFPDAVAGLLARWDLPARLLVVEITESTIMADPTTPWRSCAGPTPWACRSPLTTLVPGATGAWL